MNKPRDLLIYLFNRPSCDALHVLVSFVQFKKREKHPWRSVTFSKVGGKSTPPWVFSRFLNCTNDIKSHNASHVNELKRILDCRIFERSY